MLLAKDLFDRTDRPAVDMNIPPSPQDAILLLHGILPPQLPCLMGKAGHCTFFSTKLSFIAFKCIAISKGTSDHNHALLTFIQ
jgi:hypothetical protein